MTCPFKSVLSSLTIVEVPRPAFATSVTSCSSHLEPSPKVKTRMLSLNRRACSMTFSRLKTEPSVSKKIRFLRPVSNDYWHCLRGSRIMVPPRSAFIFLIFQRTRSLHSSSFIIQVSPSKSIASYLEPKLMMEKVHPGGRLRTKISRAS